MLHFALHQHFMPKFYVSLELRVQILNTVAYSGELHEFSVEIVLCKAFYVLYFLLVLEKLLLRTTVFEYLFRNLCAELC